MVYCIWTDVTRVITTTMVQADVEAIILQSDAYIDKLLGSQSTSDVLIKQLSVLLTAVEVKALQPTSFGAGEYRESHNPAVIWRAKIKEIVKMYKGPKVQGSAYQAIDEDDRYTEDPPA